MEFRKVGVTFVMAFAAGMLAAGCPGGAGTLGQTCTDNLSCSEGEICHPTAKVCAKTCTAPSDCSTGACNAVSGTTDMVCSCGSDADCSSEGSGFTCVSNVCAAPGAGGDGGTGGGGDGGTCSFGTCGTGQVCSNGTCVAGASCSGEGQSTCAYGQFCSNGTCADVTARPTCSNYNTAGKTQATWTPSSGSGPVIYATSLEGWPGTCTSCTNGTPVCIRYKAYRTDRNWAATAAQETTSSFYVTENGTQTDITGDPAIYSSTAANWAVSGKNLSALVRLCVPTTTQNATFGFNFSNGNEVCPAFSRQ